MQQLKERAKLFAKHDVAVRHTWKRGGQAKLEEHVPLRSRHYHQPLVPAKAGTQILLDSRLRGNDRERECLSSSELVLALLTRANQDALLEQLRSAQSPATMRRGVHPLPAYSMTSWHPGLAER
jgi:hypothetical protein